MKVTLEGRLYEQRIDRKTGKPTAGKQINEMLYDVEVDNSGLGYRNNAMLQAKEDWPGWSWSVVKVGE